MDKWRTSYKSESFPLPEGDVRHFRGQALRWASGFDTACYLDHNDYPAALAGPGFDCLIGAGTGPSLTCSAAGDHPDGPFAQWKAFCNTQPGWLFGMLSYDLKNDVEQLHSGHFDGIGFPDLHFFCPPAVVAIRGREVAVYSRDAEPGRVMKEILACAPYPDVAVPPGIAMRPRMPREDYLDVVETVRRHIVEGDLYEMNLCQEFYAEGAVVDPPALFAALNRLSPAPFAAYYRLGDRHLMCASPERFLRKEGRRLVSQPIKGTARRGATPEEDEQIRQALFHSEKDRAENVMIVDLVRNDLARSCRPGSVKVEELFGIYTFPTVHQMISTITGELRDDVHFTDAVRMAFPMGSMTGAPKVMSMELAERYERTRRGVYSGAVGYVTPERDFDFNVVIRSLLYHARRQYLSFQVGGAIVYDSDPAQEYAECLLKAKGMLGVLGAPFPLD